MAKLHCSIHKVFYWRCNGCKNLNVPMPEFIPPVEEPVKVEVLPYKSVRSTGYPPCRKSTGCKVCW